LSQFATRVLGLVVSSELGEEAMGSEAKSDSVVFEIIRSERYTMIVPLDRCDFKACRGGNIDRIIERDRIITNSELKYFKADQFARAAKTLRHNGSSLASLHFAVAANQVVG
jgi:hypothetical protein